MRLALASFEYPPETGFGGIGTYTWTHARALARAGHEVHVLAGAAKSGPLRCEREGEVTVWRGSAPPGVRRLARWIGTAGGWWSRNRIETGARMRLLLRTAAAGKPFDLVEFPDCGGEGLALESRHARSFLVRFHSPAELIMPFYDTRAGDRWLCARLERRGFRRAATATACSAFMAREIVERLGIRMPVAVVPNGFEAPADSGTAAFDLRARLGVAADRPVVLFAGRIEPRKGAGLLVELVPELLRRRALSFVLAGDDLFGIAAREIAP
ncbi:MAG: glycosyltransferase family 4 protein, partial [Thermoanaerobaculia bacterium]